MKTKPTFSLCLTFISAAVLAGCAGTRLPPEEAEHRAAARYLKEADARSATDEQRAARYLASAAEALPLLDSPTSGAASRELYNKAVADLTAFLRSAGGGRWWNRSSALNVDENIYRLSFTPGNGDGIWDPAYFTSLTPAEDVPEKTIDQPNVQAGIGGALVGVRQTNPLEPFSPRVGIAAPVTAVLAFEGSAATLTLIDPSERPTTRLAGKERALNADFSAPLAYYPATNEFWDGLMGAIRVTQHMGMTGLYMLQPYDPDRIPLIFVHGLISTPQMWRNVINELERDPLLRGRYQAWAFGYPTGNPPAYSALRLREELAKFHERYPDAKDSVLVGHSMGGLISRMQVTTLDREVWNVVGEAKAADFFRRVEPGSLVERSLFFESNPDIDRVVFICTPHRGSEMAVGTLGQLGRRLIALPANLTKTLTSTLGDAVAFATGDPHRLPNSVTGLAPNNPTFVALDHQPIEVPHHSIIGDQGKGDSPNSSDGVVPYWSSHLESATSEKIVPGPHSSCELPETIEELRRILHLHLAETDG